MIFFSISVFSEENYDITPPPLSLVFHNFGWNTLHSLTYNYGLNFIGAGLGTWALIEYDIDWKWRNIGYNNKWVANLGQPATYIGVAVPILTPIYTYLFGRYRNDEKIQITGMALVQAAFITMAYQTPLKMITGRVEPGIVNEVGQTRNPSSENFSNEFEWFNLHGVSGWPSGHTANAFAAAATIAEIYPEKIWLKIGMFSYAALMGIGVSLDVHWASESLAGALMGYAIGSTVGKSFKKYICPYLLPYYFS